MTGKSRKLIPGKTKRRTLRGPNGGLVDGPRFLRRSDKARRNLRAFKGVRLEDVK